VRPMPDLNHSSILDVVALEAQASQCSAGVPPAVARACPELAEGPSWPRTLNLSSNLADSCQTACDFRCKNLAANPSLLLKVVEQWLSKRKDIAEEPRSPSLEPKCHPSPPNPA
jgi:hypothetical protein